MRRSHWPERNRCGEEEKEKREYAEDCMAVVGRELVGPPCEVLKFLIVFEGGELELNLGGGERINHV